MDIKAKIEEFVEKIKGDKDLLAKFKKDPIKTVEGLLGIDLPEEQVKKIAEGIKAKIDIENITGKVNDIGDKLEGVLGGLFGDKKN